MSQPLPRPMSLDDFFAWQATQEVRYELVGGVPLRMVVGITNRHDRIVINLIIALGTKLRGSDCVPFTGESAFETYPGQIRRPDVGVDCGKRDPSAYKATEPRLVVEVMSPSTRDFDTIEKVEEYKAVGSLEHILSVEPNWPEVILWSRDAERSWLKRRFGELDATVDLPAIGTELVLPEIYEGIPFPPAPRLAFERNS